MDERAKTNNSVPPSLLSFIDERVAPLAKMFARTPLMSLRVKTSDGTVTFEKTAGGAISAEVARPERWADQSRHGPHRSRGQNSSITPDAEPGHQYDTVNAEIVGVFHPAGDVPAPGEPVADGRVLGFVEALKLRNPVRNWKKGIFVAQVAEEGQAVEFGEPLFVINHSDVQAEQREEEPEALEPPRL